VSIVVPPIVKPANGRATRASPRLRFWPAILVLIVAALGYGGWRIYARGQPRAARWETRAVDTGPIRQTVLSTGTLQPVLTVNVGSQISGQVEAIYVDFNSVVKKGQLLARIDPRNLQAQREQAMADLANVRASLQNAEAGVESARTGVESAETTIESARAGVASAEAARASAKAQLGQARATAEKARTQADLNHRTWSRNQELFEQGYVTPQDVDTARSAWETAEADHRTALAQVAVAATAIRSADAALRNARATLDSAVVKRATARAALMGARAQRDQAAAQVGKTRAVLGQIDVNLGYVEIRAPVDGVVIARLVDVGQTLAASFQTPVLFTVATDLRRMQVYASVDESDISHVFVGQRVSFTVNAWPSEVFHGGRVVMIRNAPQTIQNVVTYQVLIDIDNREKKLRPGMTASLTLEVAERERAVRVPNAALRFHPPEADEAGPGAPRVYLVGADGLVERPIKTGISDGAFTEVTADTLHPGEEVVVGVGSDGATPSPTRPLRVPR
jgi:HlyD family secretion protein